ncbi:ferredoxin:glutaredoxin reductase [Candidatus Fermentibacteria bacterium]|nr:ferredoxin:glutaredoxin reductase [Candidatus Fermentibacteria bacterium]
MSSRDAEELLARLETAAESAGYRINPDRSFALGLCEGLLVNQERYGYMACPCRLASGDPDGDRDIVCPCDYRDLDVEEFGSCFCALYVGEEIASGRGSPAPIPERRPPRPEDRRSAEAGNARPAPSSLPFPVWRCRVCGYLAARPGPPVTCPICKASKDRFERFM